MGLSDVAVEELRSVFRKLDADGTGEVSISNIRDIIRRIPTLNENMEEIMRVLWSLNHSAGCVNFDCFLDAMVTRHLAVQKEACRAIFDVFDFDGSGTISCNELKLASAWVRRLILLRLESKPCSECLQMRS